MYVKMCMRLLLGLLLLGLFRLLGLLPGCRIVDGGGEGQDRKGLGKGLRGVSGPLGSRGRRKLRDRGSLMVLGQGYVDQRSRKVGVRVRVRVMDKGGGQGLRDMVLHYLHSRDSAKYT